MPLKTLLWIGFFGTMCLCAIVSPIWGIVGYVGHYSVGPERQWWEAPIQGLGLRYSFILAMFTAIGIALNWRKLRHGRSLLYGHEQLLLLFLVLVWLVAFLTPETVGRYTSARIDHPTVKLAKVVMFALMLTHVVTELKNLDRVLWALIIGALILGMQAHSKPYRAFVGGRLEGVGGADFADSNMFAGYMVGLLFLIGAQFLRSGRVGKVLAFVAGGYTANAIVLTRSRAAFVGLAVGGLVCLIMSPKKYRARIALGFVIAGIGGLWLTDLRFVGRVSTISRSEDERDESAHSRIVLIKGGLRMIKDHPLGVGPGNWYQNIGSYVPQYPGKDAHNTFLKCGAELGIVGFLLFLAIIVSAIRLLHQAIKEALRLECPAGDSVALAAYGTFAALISVLAYGLTHSVNFVEYLWWFLAMPVCFSRVVDNLRADMVGALSMPESAEGIVPSQVVGKRQA